MKQPLNVILGLVPRIHSEHSSLDTGDTPEYDRDLMVDTLVKPEDDKCTIFKGWDVVRQCAALLERLKTHIKIPPLFCHPRAWLSARPEDLDSRVMPENDYKVMQCGRSMIEMLGVLAIIGVLSVGGIAGYSKAMMQFKINKTKQQIAEIITNIQTLYMQQKDFNGLNNTTAVQMGIIPDDFTISADRWSTYISDTFGNGVEINNETFSFAISIEYIQQEVCMALATTNWGSSSSGLVGVWVGSISGIFYDNHYKDFLNNIDSEGETGNNYSLGYFAGAKRLPISPANAAKVCGDPVLSGFLGFGLKFSK